MRVHARVWFLTMVCGVLLAGVLPAAAQAIGIEKFVATNCKFGHEGCAEEKIAETEETVLEGGAPKVEKFKFFEPNKEVTPTEAKNEGFVEAGGRVPYGVTDFKVASVGEYPERVPTAETTHIRTDVAPGLATNPFAVEQCSLTEFGGGPLASKGLYGAPGAECEESEIGTQEATIYTGAYPAEGFGDVPVSGRVYDLVPAAGEHMANGARLAALYGVAVKLPKFLTEAKLKAAFEAEPLPESEFPGEEAEKQAEKKGTEEALIAGQYYSHSLIKGSVEWGKEARGTNAGDFHDYFEIESEPSPPLLRSRLTFEGTNGRGDFVTNATTCPGNLTTQLTLEGVAIIGPEAGKSGVAKGTFTTPIGLEQKSCEEIEFPLNFAFGSATSVTEQPNEFTATASEEHEPEEQDVSQVKSASFTLPEGMTLNPSAASGLTACTEAQAHQDKTVFDEPFGVECPATSKIGTVSLEVPTLPPGALKGDVYLGASNSGTITDPPYKIYVVANSVEYGVSVRLLGETIPNEVTGQVTTYFNNPPEQPFTSLAIKFERGVLAPVANPLLCGEAKGSANFKPTSAPTTTHTDPFGLNITGCAATPPPFNPGQSTAVSNGNGGASTAFTFSLGRNDGEQYVGSVKTTLPPGLVGKIPAAEQCTAAAAASETTPCPAGSQIGTATVLAGSGSTPFSFSGPVYLTESVKGAPYGLSIKVPAIAGPFNLGTVVTQATIKVDPTTAQVTVESTLPTIRKGIPLRIRNISVAVNKSGFMVNPTNCGKLATVSTVGGYASLAAGGATATKSLETPFQVANCSALKFKPVFKASTSSKTSRVNGASLTTTITQPGGQSNIKSVKVQLPRQLPSRLTTLHKACTDAVFAVDPYKCPSGSFVGGASVTTPTLPGKLTGSAILVSHAGAAFPDLDLVLESTSHVRVILTGNTDIKKGITTTTFASTPDVPVTSVTVSLPVGSHSALGAFGSLCAQPLVMPTTIVGQNGATIKQNTIISVAGCGVRIVGHKVIGNTAYITVQTFAAGRISGSGSGLKTVYKHLSRAYKTVSLKVPLSSRGNARRRPSKIKLRVGFVPKKKGSHSASTVTVTFR
jgi:hypothetical protein